MPLAAFAVILAGIKKIVGFIIDYHIFTGFSAVRTYNIFSVVTA